LLFGLLVADVEATENGEDRAGSSLGSGTRKEVFGSSVNVVTVRSRLLTLFRPLRFLFCLADIFFCDPNWFKIVGF
jgi:hypothetical protein